MYIEKDPEILELQKFHLPFSGKLDPDNRWIKMKKEIPWDIIEAKYASIFAKKKGAPAKPVQMALGALIIQDTCGYTDRETIENIRENPYMQYFIGRPEYKYKKICSPSTLVFFRKRLNLKTMNEINELICKAREDKEKAVIEDKDKNDPPENKGKLILDSTCAPADIKFPTDLNLLNEAREKVEEIIDVLYEPLREEQIKPRTYRKIARRDYLRTAKNRKISLKSLTKSVGKQLRYLKRDLKVVDRLIDKSSLSLLNKKQYKDLLVVQELFHQQQEMYLKKEHRISGRIVSISQPHVRPIVRGKASAETEFGAKISISIANGYAYLEKLSWENFNESQHVKEQVEAYRQRLGCYPEVILADKIHRTRDNLSFCKSKGIRMSGPPLGRPMILGKIEARLKKKLERLEEGERNAVEGAFGTSKRRYSLDRIMTKLKETSESRIALQFLVMNLQKKLRLLLRRIFIRLFEGKIRSLACA